MTQTIAPYAVPLEGRLGRIIPDPPDDYRLPFQRDRDRIIHAQAFRRLQGKTQVFEAGQSDHLRTRLTHSLEVAQVSRDLARRMKLNEDLCECIALAHDLGHPPFGHSGEAILDTWLQKRGEHFEHNEHSLRIVTVLEKHSSLYQGLNLNREVLEGLQKHSQLTTKKGKNLAHTLEAQLVDHADAIAYTAHDTDDGLTMEILHFDGLAKLPLAAKAMERAAARKTRIRGALLSLLTEDLAQETERRIVQQGINTLKDVEDSTEPLVEFSDSMKADLGMLEGYLRKELYDHPMVARTREDGERVLMALCDQLEKNPTEDLVLHQKKFDLTLPQAIRDYVAGMTDAFARKSLIA
jgi:dGTPase